MGELPKNTQLVVDNLAPRASSDHTGSVGPLKTTLDSAPHGLGAGRHGSHACCVLLTPCPCVSHLLHVLARGCWARPAQSRAILARTERLPDARAGCAPRPRRSRLLSSACSGC